MELAPENLYLLPGMPKLIGYVPQRFRVYASRPSLAYGDLLPRIEKSVAEDVITVLGRVDPALISCAVSPLRLIEVKDFGALANSAQQQGVALWHANAGTEEQKEEARTCFAEFGSSVLKRIGLE